MEEIPLEQKILFYYENDDDYNYSEVYNCFSYLISCSDTQRNFIKEVMEINVKLYTTCFHHKLTRFKKGTLFINNIEFEIMDFNLYYYYFINNKRYHRIGICKLNKEAFEQIQYLEKQYLNLKRLLNNLEIFSNNNSLKNTLDPNVK